MVEILTMNNIRFEIEDLPDWRWVRLLMSGSLPYFRWRKRPTMHLELVTYSLLRLDCPVMAIQQGCNHPCREIVPALLHDDRVP